MTKILSILTQKLVIYIVVAMVITGGIWFSFFRKTGNTQDVLIIHPSDFVQQVSVSGKVVASENVDLGFNQGGRISGVHAKVGDIVSAGTVLASIENGDVRADLLQKQAALEGEQSKLRAIESGTRPEELAVKQSAVASAQVVLDQANLSLINAIQTSFTQSDDAIRHRVDQLISNPRSSDPRINLLVTDSQLKSDIESGRPSIETILMLWSVSLGSLNSQSELTVYSDTAGKNLDRIKTYLERVALLVNSLIPNSTLSQTIIDGYRTDIATARSNINTAASSLTSAITAKRNAAGDLTTAQNNLKLAQAGSTQEDIAGQEAHVKAAEADVQNAQARLTKTLVVAPFSGVVTKMDVKVGSIAAQSSSDISMISTATFQVESFVPEVYIALVKVSNPAMITLDAYGSGVTFPATVVSIAPAETIRDGVSTYKVKLQFPEHDARVKSGMTANAVITTEKKPNTIVVPSGIIINRDGKKFVKIKEGDTVGDRQVQTGSVSTIGQVEIVSGLKDGDTVLLNPGK